MIDKDVKLATGVLPALVGGLADDKQPRVQAAAAVNTSVGQVSPS